jgi:hypothetical protein
MVDNLVAIIVAFFGISIFVIRLIKDLMISTCDPLEAYERQRLWR